MNPKLFIAFFLAVGLVTWDWYQNQPPRVYALRVQESSNKALEADLATALKAREQVLALKQEIEQTNTLISQLLERLPKRSEAGALLEQITAVTRGLRFESVTPMGITTRTVNVRIAQPPINGTVTYEQMELAMEMLANFRDLGRYLDNLEKIPRLVEVVGLKMVGLGAGKPLSVKMTVKTYIYGGK